MKLNQLATSSNHNPTSTSAPLLEYATGNSAMPGVSAPVTVQPKLILGPSNSYASCPFCAASIKTAVQYTTTTRTHQTAALCFLVCCCCCIAYCLDSAKNTDHYCPNCKHYLGTYEK